MPNEGHRHVELRLSDDQRRGESRFDVGSAGAYESNAEAEFRLVFEDSRAVAVLIRSSETV
jgi:hypothetical protein